MALITDVLVPTLAQREVPILPGQMSGDFLYLAVVFFVLAIIAAAVGASGIAGMTMTVAKWFVIIFVVLAVLSLLL
ncbi:MAG: DUF1328 domain-containing protein [Halobacteriota archaeon]